MTNSTLNVYPLGKDEDMAEIREVIEEAVVNLDGILEDHTQLGMVIYQAHFNSPEEATTAIVELQKLDVVSFAEWGIRHL